VSIGDFSSRYGNDSSQLGSSLAIGHYRFAARASNFYGSGNKQVDPVGAGKVIRLKLSKVFRVGFAAEFELLGSMMVSESASPGG
jgi:hypothetical protein